MAIYHKKPKQYLSAHLNHQIMLFSSSIIFKDTQLAKLRKIPNIQMRRNSFYMKMPEEKVDSNSTFIVDPSGLDNLEKVFSCLLWIIINVPGNLLLF